MDEQLVSAGLRPASSFTPESGFASRPDEILDYLARHPAVQHWVALDDMDLALDDGDDTALPAECCVMTDAYTGLTDADVERAVDALRRRCDRSSLPKAQTREEMRF